jgi:hypothetical protein
MKQHALEQGSAGLLLSEADTRAAISKGVGPSVMSRWVPQPVSFTQLKSYHNPYHDRAIRIKARMTVGLGFEEVKEGTLDALPSSSKGDSFQSQLLLAAIDVESTGNGYLEILTAAGGRIGAVNWIPAESVEISEGQDWYRHVAVTPGSSARRVSYYLPWPAGGKGTLPSERYILHVSQDGTWSTWYGEPDWLGALDSVMLFHGAMRFNRASFDNNCIPTWVVFLLGASLDDTPREDANGNTLPTQRQEFMDWMSRTYGGADNAGKMLLMDLPGVSDKGSVVFQKLQDGPKDGDFLKLLDTCRDQILSAHGCPPRLAGVVVSGALGGSGEMFGQLLAFREDLRPKQEMWQQALAQLIPAMPQGAPSSLTLREIDIEQWRAQGTPTPDLPANATDQQIRYDIARMLKEAAR